MELSKQQIKQIKKLYPGKNPDQIACDLYLTKRDVYKALGLNGQLLSQRLGAAQLWLVAAILVFPPFIFLRGLSDYADLPQRVFIQASVMFLLLLACCKAFIAGHVKLPRNPAVLGAGAFIMWAFVGLTGSVNAYEGFYAVIHWGACAALFFLLASSPLEEAWLQKFFTALLIAGAGTVALGLSQHFFHVRWVPQSSAPAAGFANANVAAEYVAIMCPLMLTAGIYKRKNLFMLCTSSAAVLLGLLFLYYTRCRSAMVALVCALLWAAMLLGKMRFGAFISKLCVSVCSVAVLFSAVFLLNASPGSFNKITEGSARYRIIVWQNSLEMIKEKPLAGFGPGGFKLFYPAYTNRYVSDRAFNKATQIRRTHNDFIQAAVETGIPGAILFSFFLLYGLYLSWRFVGPERQRSDVALMISASAAIVAFMATACFGFPFQRAVQPLLVFFCLAVITAVCRRNSLDAQTVTVRIPKAACMAGLVLVCIAGGALLRFDIRNIIADSYFQRAMSMEKARANKGALSAGLKALSYNRYRMDALTTVGRAYVTTGDYAKAITSLEKVVAKSPYNLNALFILGVAHANAGQSAKALETFRRVLQIKPDFDEAKGIIASLKKNGRVRINLS